MLKTGCAVYRTGKYKPETFFQASITKVCISVHVIVGCYTTWPLGC